MQPPMLTDLAGAVGQVWRDVSRAQQPPGDEAIVGTALAALLIVLLPVTWSRARHFVTMAHEGAHGLVAFLTGRRGQGITLGRDTSGQARSHGKKRGLGIILTTAAGYPGPALLGLGAAFLLGAGHAVAVLWAAVVLLALLLLQIRNAWGLLVVLVAGGAVFAVSWWASEPAQSLVAYFATWFLLLAAPRPVLELQARRSRGGGAGSDADALAGLTHLPGLLWVVVFLAATVGALVVGAGQLWPA